ncbi:L,D-transpeptidase family protein [Antarcticirhabdus aurantiaca]|uniref:L,D-transpeptidase family protein n=1 Tax=Antarcticirhabdus aurantiaca TaxID=2606717 RepID=A0ACD4NRN2_9HYPH|nr:L,D-transpeptidase family protein [Antarcticirhabdus aurantiaca]WAJ29620.1 L,D-transpeptidase family protein [Jeongeuplla avenae]
MAGFTGRKTRLRGEKPGKPPVLAVRPAPGAGRPSRGILQAGPHRIPCALGRGGVTAFKREGDGGTPIARMRILSAFRRRGRLPGLAVSLPVRWVDPARDGWCDAPSHPAYNRPVRLPFAASHETLARADRLYDCGLVLDWNVSARARHRGSAIFLHIAKAGYRPTEGCVALHPRDLLRIAPLLRPGVALIVSR